MLRVAAACGQLQGPGRVAVVGFEQRELQVDGHAVRLEQRDLGTGEVERLARRRVVAGRRARTSPSAMTYSGRGRIAAARSNCLGGFREVAPADRQPTQAGDRRGVVGHEIERLLVRGLRGVGIAVGDQEVAEQRGDVRRVLRREAG